MYYTSDQLLTMMTRAWGFTHMPEDYHIIGIRSNLESREANKFACTFHLFHGRKLVLSTSGTTVPGKPILLGGFKRFNKKGAAVLKSDVVYYDVWKYAGWLLGLKQLGAPVWVCRDGNLNDKAEQTGIATKGWYGINFHTATRNYLKNLIIKLINGWSAGCQVANNTKDYREIIKRCKDQDAVTYTLLDEFSV